VKQEQRLLTTAPTNISKENKPTEVPTSVVVDEKFVLRIPENIDEAGAAPLLCAGITTCHQVTGK
jgi:hypothetical protein